MNDSISNLKRIAIFIFDILKGFILLFILAILFRLFIMQPFVVDGPSMEPSFYNNEYMLVEKMSGHFVGYHRGDVIILKYPNNPKVTFIKRIVALPGEKIEFVNKQVKIFSSDHPEEVVLNENYLPENVMTVSENNSSYILSENEFFVMGDNRGNSLDSRTFGPLNKKMIVGKVWFSFRTFRKIPKYKLNVFNDIINKKFAYEL